jgi:hypothetical protein
MTRTGRLTPRYTERIVRMALTHLVPAGDAIDDVVGATAVTGAS